MPQDFYDQLQPYNYIANKIDDRKAELQLRYVAKHDEDLIPAYPCVLLQLANTEREYHTTGQFMVTFRIDLWIFHNELTVDKATRSEQDIELATNIRKLIHSDRTLGGHIIHGWVDGEFPGITARVMDRDISTIVTTRLTWMGQNRVPFEAS
ncbi:MAG TPA: hypothetical protein VJQ25_09065 [Nitrospira sp.]|nr:hypothetical protein [Nitrospira sp.]